MNTDARDPIFRGLDELAGLTDQLPATDRMAGIAQKARSNRRRQVGLGVAGLAVMAAGTVVAVQLLPGGDGSDPGPAIDPTAPVAPDGLTIDLAADPIGPKTIGVTYRIHGAATAWSSIDDHGPMGYSGPSYTSIKVDGRDAGGSDGGEMECRAGAPEIAFDETWKGLGDAPLRVRVPGPGTYTVTIEAPYCGADGQVVANEVSTSVTVTGAEGGDS